MEASCLRLTELPHTSRLFADFLYHFDRVSAYYAHNPADPESFRRAAAAIDFPADRRAALVEALRSQNPESPALELLARDGTVAVVTGQQVGLFSGPAYTIYKALTAVKIARELTASGLNAVPVFWLASEDHDVAEVDHSWTFSPQHQPEILRATVAEAEQQRPVGTMRLGRIPLLELRGSLAGFPFGDEVSAMVEQAYPAGVTLGDGFRALVSGLLAKFGLLYLDPLHPQIRALGAPLLRRVVESDQDLKAQLLSRNKELEAAGYHAQVHIESETSLVFLLDRGRRLTLKRKKDAYFAKDTRYAPSELAAMADHLSPNALLRPVMQDFMLPTVAYVGGPAELAYMAQSEVLYSSLLGRMPVMTARSGFTILDARATKLLDRYGLKVSATFHGIEPLQQAVASKLLPESLHATLAHSRAEVDRQLERIRTELTSFDPTLAKAMAKSGAKIRYQLEKIERKAARETIRRDERACEDAQFLAGLIYPNKHLQERFYSILPLLAKHGLDLIDHLYDNVRLDCHDHQVLSV